SLFPFFFSTVPPTLDLCPLSLHDALPIFARAPRAPLVAVVGEVPVGDVEAELVELARRLLTGQREVGPPVHADDLVLGQIALGRVPAVVLQRPAGLLEQLGGLGVVAGVVLQLHV